MDFFDKLRARIACVPYGFSFIVVGLPVKIASPSGRGDPSPLRCAATAGMTTFRDMRKGSPALGAGEPWDKLYFPAVRRVPL